MLGHLGECHVASVQARDILGQYAGWVECFQVLGVALSLQRCGWVDYTAFSAVMLHAEANGAWWLPWSSKPVARRKAGGGFDSHPPPPLFCCILD